MRTPRNALLGLALAGGLALAVAAPASAHNPIVDSTPRNGEVLTELPAEFRIVTGDRMLYVGNDEVFGLWARDAAGLFYGDGCVRITDGTMTTDAALGEPGAYTLVAEFISIDGHPTSAEIPFEWAPAGESEAATGSATAPRCEAVPTEEPTPTADPTPTGAPTEQAAPEPGTDIPDTWWVAGALGIVALAALVTAVVVTALRRRRSE